MASEEQAAGIIVMVSPDSFRFNEQTADSNAFQQKPAEYQLQEKALQEFTAMRVKLQEHHVKVVTLPAPPLTPDAVFPNNWFSTHFDGRERTLVLYPMETENRRRERQETALKTLLARHQIHFAKVIDLTDYEQRDQYLEGTGSVIFDRQQKVAYACLSSRTHQPVLQVLADKLGYKILSFHSSDTTGKAVYHTNVMMSIGTYFAVIVTESILDHAEREKVIQSLRQSGREVIELNLTQMQAMAANILEVLATEGKPKIVMSQTAHAAYTAPQLERLLRYGEIVVVSISTIEAVGGGSARCMMAEVF